MEVAGRRGRELDGLESLDADQVPQKLPLFDVVGRLKARLHEQPAEGRLNLVQAVLVRVAVGPQLGIGAVEQLGLAVDHAEELRQVGRGAQAGGDLLVANDPLRQVGRGAQAGGDLLVANDPLRRQLDGDCGPGGIVVEQRADHGPLPGVVRPVAPLDEADRGHLGHRHRQLVVPARERRRGREARPAMQVEAARAVARHGLVQRVGDALGVVALGVTGPGAVHVVPAIVAVGLLGPEADVRAAVPQCRQVGEGHQEDLAGAQTLLAHLAEAPDHLAALHLVPVLGGEHQ